MASWVHVFLIVHLLLIQGYMNKKTHCKEAVESVETVSSCPTSKEQWDKASSRKKCWERALKQSCSRPGKFVYHCVINGYGNATLEVCAPERLILGHCTEFNEVGGVIQDQLFTKCNGVFPKCDDFYLSSEAYKYKDCYKIVEANRLTTSTSKNVKHVPSDEKVDRDDSTILLLAGGSFVSGFVGLIISILYVIRRKISRWKREEKELSGDKIMSRRTYEIGSEENSDQQLQDKQCLSSERRNDDLEVLKVSTSLLGQVYDHNTLGFSKVKRRQQE